MVTKIGRRVQEESLTLYGSGILELLAHFFFAAGGDSISSFNGTGFSSLSSSSIDSLNGDDSIGTSEEKDQRLLS